MSIWCATTSFAGARLRRRALIVSGERAANATLVFATLATVGIAWALLSRDFSYAYVAEHISANMPDVYVLAALWSGAGGSILLWIAWLSLATVALVRSARDSLATMPLVTGVLGVILSVLIGMVAFESNPFDRLEVVPADGRGMNPQLQNPGMMLHPPLLILGLVTTAVPFAVAIAALLRRSLDISSVADLRRWTLVSWLCLGMGMLSGMWWAYIEPGWGGYWSWDPVQSAVLLPWLASTAFLHAAMSHARVGGFQRWLLTLATLPFLLAVFAAFVARGTLFPSLHAFAQSGAGAWFSALLMLASVGTAYLVTAFPAPAPAPRIERLVSREAGLLYNTVVLIGIAFSIFWGLLFPLISVWLSDTRVAVGAPFFNAVNGPFIPVLLALMGVAQLLPWGGARPAWRARLRWPILAGILVGAVAWILGLRDTSTIVTGALATFVVASIVPAIAERDAGTIGGYVVHAGIALLCVALTGNAFARTHDVSITAGETYAATDPFGRQWRFVSQGISTSQYRNSEVTALALEVFRDGQSIGFVSSERRQYLDSHGHPLFDPSSESGILTNVREDIYVVLAAVNDEVAEVRISFNPLVLWVWIGGAVVLVGGVMVIASTAMPAGFAANSSGPLAGKAP